MAGDIKKIHAAKFAADMKDETYECKNPVLFKALKEHPSALDIALPAAAAEALGKRLQSLQKNESGKLTETTLSQAISDVETYDEVNNDAMYFRKENTLRILMTTWAKGGEVAACLGIDDKTYAEMCRNMNKNYAPEVNGVEDKQNTL